MPHDISLITTMAGGLGLALLLGLLAARLKLPPLFGYLLAGILIGPHTPGFVADTALAAQLAEIGVMLLMFGVGLHFSTEELLRVKNIAIPGAIVQMTVATLMGGAAAYYWGWGLAGALVFGLALSVASTVVLLKALEARGQLDSVNGRIAVGWLVVEDLMMALALVLLPPLAGLLLAYESTEAVRQTPDALAMTVLVTLAKAAAFVVLMLLAGKRLLPKFLWQVARTGSRELFTLCVISAALGVALGAAKLFDVSFALGAFFAGMMLRESELSHRAAEESLPLRDAFSVLFFVSVGMLFDPLVLVQEPIKVLVVSLIIIVGKTLAAIILVLLFRYPLNSALTIGASLAQIGEFSFILAGLGVTLNLLPEPGRSLILAGALISISFNPFLFAAIEPLQQRLRAHSRLARLFERSADPLAELPMSTDLKKLSGQLVLAGDSAATETFALKLLQQGVPVVVAEPNRKLVEQLRTQGIAAVSGDPVEPVVLIQAHIARAAVLLILSADPPRAAKMIEVARALNPQIRIAVQASSSEAEGFRALQVDEIFIDEELRSSAMLGYVQRCLTSSTD
jgi:CPA2 family monovalent cation:H+ antiporter-2